MIHASPEYALLCTGRRQDAALPGCLPDRGCRPRSLMPDRVMQKQYTHAEQQPQLHTAFILLDDNLSDLPAGGCFAMTPPCSMSHIPPAASRQSVRASTMLQASAKCPLSWLQSAGGPLPSPAGQLLAANACHPCTSQSLGWGRCCVALSRPAPSRTARSNSRWREAAVSAAGNACPAANSSVARPSAKKVHVSESFLPTQQLR